VYTLCESVQGYIAKESWGFGGFGYDPVFVVSAINKTMAELSDEEKDQYSRRGRASRLLNTLLGALV
ncbi:MAG: non-canonical purine NTP pyrophosphatase, partial [Spirochaetia bacterium]|nr:non-canonical purine NTP pyrophosphatase [Spirochaetia bacterium]